MASSCGITSSNGYLIHAEPYCGSNTDLLKTDLGQWADVVLGLLHKRNIDIDSIVTFDNLFTSLPLLVKLTEKGIGGLGTIQQNRLQDALLRKEELVKMERGSFDFGSDGNNLIVSRIDNKLVTIGTNYV